MKQQRIALALLMSLIISGGCTYLLARKINARSAPRTVADAMYVAPAHALDAGEVLKPESVTLTPWPGEHPLHGTFLKPSDLVGRTLLYPVEKGQPILERDVTAAGAGAGLAAKIPDGMRAIALRTDEVAGVAGFLGPGSHVDVLVTYHVAQSNDPITTTVLEDVQVLAAGQRAQPDPEGKPAPTTTVVTLLLNPEESERAVLASSQGMIHFVLRNGADTGRTHQPAMLLSMLSGAPAPAAAPVAPARAIQRTAAPIRETQIETILGNDQASAKGSGSGQP